MGRRSLPRIDKNIDLRDHFLSLEDMSEEWDLLQILRPNAKIELEVGSGKGLFLAGAAKSHPDHDFVGIEIARKYARFAAARLARHGLENARLIHGDAMLLITKKIPDASLTAVHVYFPDPWWKKRHRKRRIMNEIFLNQVQRTLQPGGVLHFWTDVHEYFEESLSLIQTCTRLEGPFEVPEATPEHDLDYRTHFERRMRQHDRPVYRSLFRNSDAPF